MGGFLTAEQDQSLTKGFKRGKLLRKKGIHGELMDGPRSAVAQTSHQLAESNKANETLAAAAGGIGARGKDSKGTVGGKQAMGSLIAGTGRGQAAKATAQFKGGALQGQFEAGGGILNAVNKTRIHQSDLQFQQAVAEAEHAQMVENQRVAKKNADKGGGMMGGIGAVAGLAIGAILAAPTGGMSLYAGAAMGSAIGGAAGAGADMFMQ
jgi:hypothetical protein